MHAVCNLSIVPVRKEPSDKSELVSQLLFGETVEVMDMQDSWRKVRMLFDNYTGWIDKKQIINITDDELLKIKTSKTFISSDLVQLAIWDKNQICPVVLGSFLPAYQDHKFFIGETEYVFEGNVIENGIPDSSRLLEHAYMYMNSPYLWGGRSPFGIDCSGFTQMVYKLCGFSLNRDSFKQAEQGITINLLEESKAGDLAFFDNAEGKITHVGIILPGSQIIHASGRVRIEKLDHQGIFNEELKGYSHNLRLIKRNF
jgi:hypothetical protein